MAQDVAPRAERCFTVKPFLVLKGALLLEMDFSGHVPRLGLRKGGMLFRDTGPFQSPVSTLARAGHLQLAGVGQASQGLFQALPMLYEQQHIFLVMLKESSFSQVSL